MKDAADARLSFPPSLRPRRRKTAAFEAILPDIAKGVRAAVATLGPFYFAASTGRTELAWVAIGGWLGTLADPGGTRRDRAISIGQFTVAGFGVVALSALASKTAVAGGAALVGFAFLLSLARAYGGSAGTTGTLLLVTSAIATSRGTLHPVVEGAAFAVGAVWATFLSSIVWPVWTHFPLRVAIDHVWRSLATFADDIAAALDVPPGDPRWGALAREDHKTIRAAVEHARNAALASRARHGGESRVGAGLRVSLGAAEACFPLLVALAEEAESSADRDEAKRLVRLIGDRLRHPGGRVVPSGEIGTGHLAYVVARLLDASTFRVAAPGEGAEGEKSTDAGAWFAPLRDALSTRSSIFRHAVRVAVAVLAAAVAGAYFSPAHAQWVSITTIAVLQPYPGATVVRAIERTVGTIFGSAVAAAITLLVVAPWALSLVMVPLSIAALATKPRSYRLFTFFLTPVFVLLAERYHGDWWTAAARAGDAALGGGIALVAALVFGSWEKTRIGDATSAALDALSGYCHAVFGGAVDRAERRRAVGIALADMETSLERLLAEPLRSKTEATRIMQIITSARRLSGAATTLDAHADDALRARAKGELQAYVDLAIEATRTGTGSPADRPRPTTSTLARVAEHAALLANAGATRLTGRSDVDGRHGERD